jgi:hypothetical protein
MPVFAARMIVVGAFQFEGAENAIDGGGKAPFELLFGLGLIGSVDAIRRFLKKKSNQRAGRFENGGAQENFQILHRQTAGRRALETGNKPLDFLVLGEMERRGWFFFFEPSAMAARVSCTFNSAYSSVSV